MTTRMRVLQLYRQIRREGQKITDYNFRNYALRRARDAFKEHKVETNPEKIEAFIQKAEVNLAMLKRQATISQLYQAPSPLVVENLPDPPKST